ncbi:hypothetical protein B0H17DRAFT_1212547 [Mycena rosella]|uniref:Uncharacterized protein n=1 Tax=Mycena rosella TaxID=1033263 RepID=A0AAD7CRU8_MYCRO|nr:hypothetical protein B0H17DRAFT_1212547 [Mycena rosella]
MSTFNGLTVLVVRDLYDDMDPTADELIAVLRSNPSLVKLSLRFRLVASTVAAYTGQVVLPSLLELELAPCGDPAFGRVLAVCVFPRLAAVRYIFTTKEDIDTLGVIEAQLVHVTAFYASGTAYDSLHLRQLFLAMPVLSILNLCNTDSNFFASVEDFAPVEAVITDEVTGGLILPAELFHEIFLLAYVAQDPYDVDGLLRDRHSFSVVHSGIMDFIEKNPVCWSHILLSPKVPFEAVEKSIRNVCGHKFTLTLRLDEPATLQSHVSTHAFV